jgi:hypothetical protein
MKVMKESFFSSFLKDESGQSLMEIIVGLTIGAILIGTASFGIAFMIRSTSTNQSLSTASQLTQGILSNVQTFSGSEWQNVYGLSKGSTNQYFLVASGTAYFAAAGQEGVLGNDVTNGLIGRWSFDENVASTSTMTYDMSGNGNNGTLTAGPTRASSTCKISNCLNFDGTDDYVNVPDSNILDIGTGDLSITVWIKTSNPNFRMIVSKGSLCQGDSANCYRLNMNGSGTVGAYIESGDGDTWVGSAGGTKVVSDNIWHHVAAVFNRTGNMIVYIDGIQDSSVDISGETASLANGNNLQIGRRVPGTYFEGLMDDVRVYNRALSATEVQQLFGSQAFTRYFYVENACRTSGGDIASSTYPCSGGSSDDPLTQKVTAITQWLSGASLDEVNLDRYITRWGNFSIRQTDWSGGSGQDGPIIAPNDQFSSSTNITPTSTFGSFEIQNLTQQ